MKKVLKYIVGALGSLFALAHMVAILLKFASGFRAGEYTISAYSGHIAGFCIGAIVAALCFRRAKKTESADESREP